MEQSVNKMEIFVNKFDEESARDFAKQLNEATMIDPNHPITIVIDSFGGQAFSLINMIESLRQVHNPIVTVCKGKAMSCGAMLLAMGDQRFCGKDSSIMIHEISAGTIGHVDDMKVDAEETIRLNLQVMTILAERCKMTYKQMKDKITLNGRRDLYLTAQQAKEFGLIDAVGIPVIKPVIMYTIDVVPEKRVTFEQQVPEKIIKKLNKRKSKTKTVSKSKKKK